MKNAITKSVVLHAVLLMMLYNGTAFTGLKPEPKKVTLDLSQFCTPAEEQPALPEPPAPEQPPVPEKQPQAKQKEQAAQQKQAPEKKYEQVVSAAVTSVPAAPAHVPAVQEPEPFHTLPQQTANEAPAPVQTAKAADTPVRKLFDYDGYKNRLGAKLESGKVYPLMAKRRGIEGLVKLKLKIAADGTLLESEVVSSSGSDILDREAMVLVRSAFPVKHDAGETLSVVVPVMYKLY